MGRSRDDKRAADSARHRRNYEAGPEVALARNRAWREANPEQARASSLAAGRRHRAKDPGAMRAYKRDWARANPDRVRAAALRAKFGIDLDELAAQVAHQGGCCAICRDELRGGRYQHVDHDHARPGTARGVLCSECNTALGKFDDSPDVLERAAAYLRAGGAWRGKG